MKKTILGLGALVLGSSIYANEIQDKILSQAEDILDKANHSYFSIKAKQYVLGSKEWVPNGFIITPEGYVRLCEFNQELRDMKCHPSIKTGDEFIEYLKGIKGVKKAEYSI
tara:strand:+ start:452 stop:784 length:333 start_codon:yes stop_codon:yes gene_type:complete